MSKTNIDQFDSDEALMLRYAQGDFGAFETLYKRHKGGVYRYFMRQLANPALAEDLFQECWGKVISHAVQYQIKAKFTTWLYTLAKHLLIDHLRHLKVVDKVIESSEESGLNLSLDSAFHSLSPEAKLQEHHVAMALLSCVEDLPLVQRECFLLKEETGLSLQDIAIIVNANFDACKSRLRYAYQHLRECVTAKTGWEFEHHE